MCSHLKNSAVELFQSSLRDSSIVRANPGLRPGLSSAVPTGLVIEMAILTQGLGRTEVVS